MEAKTNQNRSIEEVLIFLCECINIKYEITGYSDETERNLPACDVLAHIGTKNVAIEHTSIDSLQNQRGDSDRLNKVLGPLESELKNRLLMSGHYQLVVPINAIPAGKGISWDVIRERIRDWCLEVAPTLEVGGPIAAPKHFARSMLPGVPFEVTLYRWPRREGQFEVARFSPEDLEAQRKKVIRKAIESRGKKMSTYRKDGFRTILVLESNDKALANVSVVGQAFLSILNEVVSTMLPDEVYLVETEMEPYTVYCLKFGDTLFPNATISKQPYVT